MASPKKVISLTDLPGDALPDVDDEMSFPTVWLLCPFSQCAPDLLGDDVERDLSGKLLGDVGSARNRWRSRSRPVAAELPGGHLGRKWWWVKGCPVVNEGLLGRICY
ncbi:hypothetical protein Dimus_010444 [Dionaea muscipula]